MVFFCSDVIEILEFKSLLLHIVYFKLFLRVQNFNRGGFFLGIHDKVLFQK